MFCVQLLTLARAGIPCILLLHLCVGHGSMRTSSVLSSRLACKHGVQLSGSRTPHARARSQTARLMQPARAGVIACAVIMTIATLAVIESAARDLTAGFFHGAPPPP